MLLNLVQELKEKTRDLSDSGKNDERIISYYLKGKIVIDNKYEKIYFEGKLGYKTNFESLLISGIPQQRALNAGKMSYAPVEDSRIKRDLIVEIARERSKEKGYIFSYDKKEESITIKVLRNLRKESGIIGKELGKPTKKIFDI